VWAFGPGGCAAARWVAHGAPRVAHALLHMPLAAQPRPLRHAASWLRPAGWLLVIAGHRAWTGMEDNWLGGAAPMW